MFDLGEHTFRVEEVILTNRALALEKKVNKFIIVKIKNALGHLDGSEGWALPSDSVMISRS